MQPIHYVIIVLVLIIIFLAVIRANKKDFKLEINKLELERLKIIKVLQNRIPSLKNDINLQPKKKVRKYEKIIKE